MHPTFENALATYCAPTLSGIKPASLMACERSAYPDLCDLIPQYANTLAPYGIGFARMCRCMHSTLLLVYQKDLLEKHLAEPASAALLKSAGYPSPGPLQVMLKHLKQRMQYHPDFPHEIGVFLGYPQEDICGFQQHKGQNYKFSGYWKVYSDVERAKRCFARYDHCREHLFRLLAQGKSLSQVFPAA